MTNEFYRELLTRKKTIISEMDKIECDYKTKTYPNDLISQMMPIADSVDLGKEYEYLCREYDDVVHKIADHVRGHRWQVSIWNEQKPFGEQNTIIGNYTDRETAKKIADMIDGAVHYDDSVPEL